MKARDCTQFKSMKCLIFTIHKIYSGDWRSKGDRLRYLQSFQPEDSNTCCSEVFPNSNIELCGQNKQYRKLFWAKEPGRECDVGPENQVKWPSGQPTQC